MATDDEVEPVLRLPDGTVVPRPERPTRKAVQACAEWLAACLRLGWPREKLDMLEAIWWWDHDRHGRLKPVEAKPARKRGAK